MAASFLLTVMKVWWRIFGAALALAAVAFVFWLRPILNRCVDYIHHGYIVVRAVEPVSSEPDVETERLAALLHPTLTNAGFQLSQESRPEVWKYYARHLLMERGSNTFVTLHFSGFGPKSSAEGAKKAEQKVFQLLSPRKDLEIRRMNYREYREWQSAPDNGTR